MLDRKMEHFVGLDNLPFLLTRHSFQLVIFQSCLFAITAVVMKALIGFIVAHLMHNIRGRNQRIWRGLLLVPWVIPLALLHADLVVAVRPVLFGVQLDAQLAGLRIDPFLGTTWNARIAVIAVNVWFGAPFFMIMYLAALKSVPEQLYEAAAIDGATAWQKLRFITLPMMRNIILITMLYSLIVTFRRLRHRAHPDQWRPAGQHPPVRHLCIQRRYRVGQHSAWCFGQPVHVPRSWQRSPSSCCAMSLKRSREVST